MNIGVRFFESKQVACEWANSVQVELSTQVKAACVFVLKNHEGRFFINVHAFGDFEASRTIDPSGVLIHYDPTEMVWPYSCATVRHGVGVAEMLPQTLGPTQFEATAEPHPTILQTLVEWERARLVLPRWVQGPRGRCMALIVLIDTEKHLWKDVLFHGHLLRLRTAYPKLVEALTEYVQEPLKP